MYSMVLMMAVSAAPDAAACHKTYSCTGCTGCYGTVVVAAPVVYSCTGCTGTCHGGLFSCGCSGYSCSGTIHYTGCHGGLFNKHGCSGCTGYSCGGCYGTPVIGTPPVEPKKEMVPVPPMKTSLPANITVNVPADAKIMIDGAPTTSTQAVRLFATPALEAGTVYYYTFSAEIVRSGKTYTAVEKVAVEAGSNPTITLNPIVSESVASK